MYVSIYDKKEETMVWETVYKMPIIIVLWGRSRVT